MPKHKVIAQTWAKRKDFEDKGRLSITLYNTHTDPVGLNFDVNDLNSSETNEISSTWVHYLPQCVKRRMALTGATTGNTNSSSQGQAGRKNSLDSEISVSVRHVSVESRRNSVDSQVSVKIAEMKTKVASRTRQHSKHGYSSSSNKRTQRRRDFIAASSGRTAKYSSGAAGRGRRESSTSVESQVIALKKTTYPNASHKVGMFAHQSTKKHHNSTRHRRNAGLDPTIINDFIQKNGQFILPFLQNQGMTTSSDEEENSRASFKIHDLNVVVKQEVSDDDDDDDDEAQPKVQELPSNASKAQALEQFLKHMQKSNESNRHSRNSQRSRKSRNKEHAKQQHHHLNLDLDVDSNSDFKQHYVRQLTAAIDANADSLSCSSVELDIPLGGGLMHSSYSGMSTGKPNSRNSKTSCDVGIQANPFEIATHTLPTYGNEELQQAMRLLNAASRQRNEQNFEDATEMQSLLGPRHHHKEPTLMSESDKLKMLLLPSK